MGVLKLLGLLCAAGAVGVGYLIVTTPVPDDLEHRDIARIAGATGKLTIHLSNVLHKLGLCSRLDFSRYMIGLNAKIRRRSDVKAGDYEEMDLDGVKVRFYQSKEKKDRGSTATPVIVYLAGGGWVTQEPDLYHKTIKNLTETTGFSTILVLYKVAPEHPFPRAVEDCEKVVEYLWENSEKLNIDPTRIAVMGDSAGGNLAAVVSISMKEIPKFVMLMNAPFQGLDLNLPSYRENSGTVSTADSTAFITVTYLLGKEPTDEQKNLAMKNLLYSSSVWKEHAHKISQDLLPDKIKQKKIEPVLVPDDNEGFSDKLDSLVANWKFSPLLADDLSGLPETYIFSCEYDVFRDDSYLFASRLKEAGVTVTHRNDPCFHGAMVIVRDHPLWNDIAEILKEKLA